MNPRRPQPFGSPPDPPPPRRDTVVAPATQRALEATAHTRVDPPGTAPDVSALMRRQLRLSLLVTLTGAAVLVLLPALFTFLPRLDGWPHPVAPGWIAAAALLPPPLLVAAVALYTRRSELLDARGAREGATRR